MPRPGTKRNVGTEKNILQDDYFFLVRESPHLVKEQIENPKTTNTERAKTSKKGEGWVKGGEGLAPPFTSQNPSVYRHFGRKGEG